MINKPKILNVRVIVIDKLNPEINRSKMFAVNMPDDVESWVESWIVSFNDLSKNWECTCIDDEIYGDCFHKRLVVPIQTLFEEDFLSLDVYTSESERCPLCNSNLYLRLIYSCSAEETLYQCTDCNWIFYGNVKAKNWKLQKVKQVEQSLLSAIFEDKSTSLLLERLGIKL